MHVGDKFVVHGGDGTALASSRTGLRFAIARGKVAFYNFADGLSPACCKERHLIKNSNLAMVGANGGVFTQAYLDLSFALKIDR
jgi:hypothetical protein